MIRGYKKLIFLYCLIIVSIICFFLSSRINEVYRYLWLWPTSYTVVYTMFFLNLRIKKDHSIVLNLVIYFQLFMRYVTYPALVSFTNSSFIGIQHFAMGDKSIFQATFLGIFELAFAGIFIYGLENFKIKHKYKAQNDSIRKPYFYISGNKNVYGFYILFAIFIYMAVGRNYNIINFLSISDTVQANNIYISLIKYVVIIGICMIVLLIFDYSKKRYDYYHKRIYVAISLIAALLFVSIVQGESRTSQVYVAFIMIMMLSDMFPKHKKALGISVGGALISVIIIITSFREGSLNQWLGSLEMLVGRLQIYLGGPVSIATSIEVFTKFSNISISNLLFDFLRSIFGLNLIFKNVGYTTSQLYNLYLYSGQYVNGHIIFSTSYGYIFLGLLGVPLTLCFNIWLSCFFNNKFNEAKSFEAKYLFGYCMLRVVSGILVNTPSFLGGITQYLGTFGLVILFSKVFKKSHKTYTKNCKELGYENH